VKLVDIPEEKECLQAISNGLETNSKNKDVRALDRDIHDFKNVYQAITYIRKKVYPCTGTEALYRPYGL
jgi:hypothetical protein